MLDLLGEELRDFQVAQLEEQASREELSSSKVFELAEQAASKSAAKFHRDEAMVGVVVKVAVTDAQDSLLVDLKTGPHLKVFRGSQSTKADITLTFTSESQFRGVLSKRLDMQKLVKLGQVQVDGSFRTKMKLMPLIDLGKKIQVEMQERKNKQVMESIQWEDEPIRGSYSGQLDKKSVWLKQWNSRWFTLDWDPYHRPTLSYATRKNGPAKMSLELHSSCTVEPRVTTRTDKRNQAAFALVDRRSGQDIMVLCAASEEDRVTWLRKLKAAISARVRSRQLEPLTPGSSLSGKRFVPPATPKTTIQKTEQDVEQGERESLPEGGKHPLPSISEQLEALEASLVASGVESHLSFLLRKLSWRIVPCLVALTVLIRRTRLFLLRILPGTVLGQSLLVAATGLVARTVLNSPFFELFRRRMRVYLLSARLIMDLKITDLKAEELPEVHANAVWKTKQRAVAEELYYHSLSLGGFWVKVAQSLGARPDVFPPTITNVLGRLQDNVPPTPFAQLRPFLEKEMGCPVEQVFARFEAEPIAAASIGQVHLAELKDGSKVVVKVQHPGIESKLRQDVYNMGVVLRWISLVDNKLDLGPILDHWRQNVLRELDFLHELDNMSQVGANLAKSSTIYATVPKALVSEGLCSQRVMVMRFVKGVKVTNLKALSDVGITGYNARGVLAKDICDAFSHQMFIDGLFNADPHPGNVLVARREDIDEGQVVNLPTSSSDAEGVDPNRPVPVLLDFGLALQLPDNIRLGLSRMVYSGSQFDIGGLLWSLDMLGVVLTREDVIEDMGGLQHMFRDTAPTEESRKETLARIEIEKQKFADKDFENPVAAFPPEMVLFFRSLNLLRGLCSSLEVRQPFIKILSAWARKALRRQYSVVDEDTEPEPIASTPDTDAMFPLEPKLRSFLAKKRGEYVGLQIALIDESRGVEMTVSHGSLAEDDPRPVDDSTLFQGSALAQSVTQILAHLAVGKASKSASRSSPERAVLQGDLQLLSSNGKLLDPACVPSTFSTKTARNWRDSIDHVQSVFSAINTAAGSEKNDKDIEQVKLPHEAAHAAFLWGWLGMKIAQDNLGEHKESDEPEIARLAKEELAAFGDFRLGMPTVEAAQALYEDGRATRLSFPVQELLEQHGIQDFGSLGDIETLQEKGGGGLGIITEMVPGLKGKEYWVDPRMVNNPRILSACLPSSNLLCSARSLASLFHALSHNGKAFHSGHVLPEHVTQSIHQAVLQGKSGMDPFAGHSMGLRTFSFMKGEEEIYAIGQIAFGGNSVLTFPSLGISIAVLVNQMSLTRELVQGILDVVYEFYGICPEGEF